MAEPEQTFRELPLIRTVPCQCGKVLLTVHNDLGPWDCPCGKTLTLADSYVPLERRRERP